MVNKEYLRINAVKLGLAAGITFAVTVFLTTLTGIYGYSNAANILISTIWGSFGYSLTLTGALIGAILGFIYAFVLTWIPVTIYNKLIS